MQEIKTECLQMLQEEAEEASKLEPLPEWIHSLFSCSMDNSLSDAIKHLETASSQCLFDQFTRLEEAQQTQRAQTFTVQLEELRTNATRLYSRLAPFEFLSPQHQQVIDYLENVNSKTISRTQLKNVCTEWKLIEKERQESISGSVLLIGRLWDLLQVSVEERFPLDSEDISLIALKRLEGERRRLIDFQQAHFRELYDSHLAELYRLTDALKWSKDRRTALLKGHESYTAEGLQIISRQLAILQPRLALTEELLTLIGNRNVLIQKMRDFERSASDPARLFRSSFQLLQEEKFRKTALPSLLAGEHKIQAKLAEYCDGFGEEFVLEAERPFSQVLEEEIAARYLNEGIFGFDRNREIRLKDTKDHKTDSKEPSKEVPRYSKKLSTIGTSSQSTTSATIPQRRPISKLQ